MHIAPPATRELPYVMESGRNGLVLHACTRAHDVSASGCIPLQAFQALDNSSVGARRFLLPCCPANPRSTADSHRVLRFRGRCPWLHQFRSHLETSPPLASHCRRSISSRVPLRHPPLTCRLPSRRPLVRYRQGPGLFGSEPKHSNPLHSCPD